MIFELRLEVRNWRAIWKSGRWTFQARRRPKRLWSRLRFAGYVIIWVGFKVWIEFRHLSKSQMRLLLFFYFHKTASFCWLFQSESNVLLLSVQFLAFWRFRLGYLASVNSEQFLNKYRGRKEAALGLKEMT